MARGEQGAALSRAVGIAQPKTFSTERTLRLVVPPPGFTLSPGDILDLRFFFCEYEADAGVSSTFGPMLAALAGVQMGTGGYRDYHEAPAALVDGRVTKRANRVRRRLLAMVDRGESALMTVLYRLYGPRCPSAPYEEFGELAPLAELTEAADEAREEMARKEGAARTESAGEALDPEKRERDFWWAAGHFTKLDDAVAKLTAEAKAEPSEALAAAIGERKARRAAWREVMRTAMNGTVNAASAQRTAGASADRELTTAAALRWRLDFHGKRNAEGAADADAKKAWKFARSGFVARVRRGAEQLRAEAGRAYAASVGA